MDTYQLAEVAEREGSVWLSCTQAPEVREVLAELGRLFPQWRIRPRKKYTADSGDETGWLVDKCAGRHRYAVWWLNRQLCARGWEPFAVAHEPSRELYTSPLYLFRRKVA